MEPVLEAILYTAGESGVKLGKLASILEISESAMRQQLEAYQQRLAADDSADYKYNSLPIGITY